MKKQQHPNSLANLMPFEKGISGNPSGRAIAFKGLEKELKEIGNEEIWTNPDPLEIWDEEKKLIGTRRELVLSAIWSKAEGGDLAFIMILERLGCLESK
jgi:hypothetical protein